jgi:hypothetical protein
MNWALGGINIRPKWRFGIGFIWGCDQTIRKDSLSAGRFGQKQLHPMKIVIQSIGGCPTFQLLGPLVQQGNWHHHQYMSPTGARRVHGLYQCTGLPELESQCASGNRNRWTVYSTIPSRQERKGKLGMVDPIALKVNNDSWRRRAQCI